MYTRNSRKIETYAITKWLAKPDYKPLNKSYSIWQVKSGLQSKKNKKRSIYIKSLMLKTNCY